MKINQLFLIFLLVFFLLIVNAEDEITDDKLMSHASVASVSHLQGFNGISYNWMPQAIKYYANPKLGDPTLQGMLQEAIANNLSAKGYVFSNSDTGVDFLVGYIAALDSSLNSEEIGKIYGINPGLPELSNDLNKFEKGTLIVHMFDSKNGKLLWRGALQVEVKLKNDHNARWQRVQKAVALLLHRFPAYKE